VGEIPAEILDELFKRTVSMPFEKADDDFKLLSTKECDEGVVLFVKTHLSKNK
jgi:hypothetical protein